MSSRKLEDFLGESERAELTELQSMMDEAMRLRARLAELNKRDACPKEADLQKLSSEVDAYLARLSKMLSK